MVTCKRIANVLRRVLLAEASDFLDHPIYRIKCAINKEKFWEDKEEQGRTFDLETAVKFMGKFGIDALSLGLPYLERDPQTSDHQYYNRRFENLKVCVDRNADIDNWDVPFPNFRARLTGDYFYQCRIAKRNSIGEWQPAEETKKHIDYSWAKPLDEL